MDTIRKTELLHHIDTPHEPCSNPVWLLQHYLDVCKKQYYSFLKVIKDVVCWSLLWASKGETPMHEAQLMLYGSLALIFYIGLALISVCKT